MPIGEKENTGHGVNSNGLRETALDLCETFLPFQRKDDTIALRSPRLESWDRIADSGSEYIGEAMMRTGAVNRTTGDADRGSAQDNRRCRPG